MNSGPSSSTRRDVLRKTLQTGACLTFPWLFKGCATSTGRDPFEDSGPVFGGASSRETRFVAGSDGGPLKVSSLAKVGDTIRKYRDLNASEAQILEALARQRFDGMMVSEYRTLAPKYQPKVAAIKKRATERVVVARNRVNVPSPQPRPKPAPTTPDEITLEDLPKAQASDPPAVVQEINAIEAEAKQQLAALAQSWKEEAVSSIASSGPTGFAMPIKNQDGQAVVAFAKIQGPDLMVQKSAYVLNVDPDSLSRASKGSMTASVGHEGGTYAVLSSN